MANERYTRTNQKLFFAGLALEQWRQAEADARNAPGKVQAEREACLFHMYGALLGLCHEVTGFYRTPQMDARSVEEILSRAAFEASPSAELGELVEIAESQHSWIAELLAHYRVLFEPPRPPKKAKQDPSTPLIEAVVVEDATPALSTEQVEAWRQALKGLALRFRETMTEW